MINTMVNMVIIWIILYSIRGIMVQIMVRGMNELLKVGGKEAVAVLVEMVCVGVSGDKRDYIGHYVFEDYRGDKYTHEKVLEGLPSDMEKLAEDTAESLEVAVVYLEDDPSYSVIKEDLETYIIDTKEMTIKFITVTLAMALLSIRMGV